MRVEYAEHVYSVPEGGYVRTPDLPEVTPRILEYAVTPRTFEYARTLAFPKLTLRTFAQFLDESPFNYVHGESGMDEAELTALFGELSARRTARREESSTGKVSEFRVHVSGNTVFMPGMPPETARVVFITPYGSWKTSEFADSAEGGAVSLCPVDEDGWSVCSDLYEGDVLVQRNDIVVPSGLNRVTACQAVANIRALMVEAREILPDPYPDV